MRLRFLWKWLFDHSGSQRLDQDEQERILDAISAGSGMQEPVSVPSM